MRLFRATLWLSGNALTIIQRGKIDILRPQERRVPSRCGQNQAIDHRQLQIAGSLTALKTVVTSSSRSYPWIMTAMTCENSAIL